MSVEIVQAAKTAASTQISDLLQKGQAEFLATFGTFVNPDGVAELKVLLVDAAEAKAAQFAASDEKTAQEYADEYDAYMDEIETIGDDYEIVGKAKAGSLMRSMAHQIIAGAFAVGGAVLQAALGVVLPGFGSLIGAAANSGLQAVMAHYLT